MQIVYITGFDYVHEMNNEKEKEKKRLRQKPTQLAQNQNQF